MSKSKLVVFFAILFIVPRCVWASDNLVNIYLFHSRDCFHCKDEIKFLDLVSERYSNVRVYKYEIHDSDNNDKYKKIAELYGLSADVVPFTVIGDKFFTGFNRQSSRVVFNRAIVYYSKYGYDDRVSSVVGVNDLPRLKVKKDQVSVNSFIKKYGNYKVVGSIKIDDIGISLSVFIFSVFMEFNFINLFFMFFILVVLFKLRNIKDKIICLWLYVCSYLFSNIVFLLSRKILTVLMFILLIVGIIYFIFGYFFNKKGRNISLILVLIAGVINNLFKFEYFSGDVFRIRRIISLNILSFWETIYIYIINMFGILLVFLLIFVLFLFFKNILVKRLLSIKRCN